MNISFENPDKVNGLLTITVEESDFQDSVEKTLKDYRKKANIPGFRPGQAPMGLIKRQFGASVRYDAVNKFVGEQLYKYIKDNNIQMLGEPLPSDKHRKTGSLHIRIRHRCCSGVHNQPRRSQQDRLLHNQG